MWLYQRLTMFWNGTNVTKLSVIQSRDDDCVDWSQRPNAGEGRGLPATGLTWPADAGAGRFCVHGFPFLFIVITWPEMYYVIFIGRIDFERDTFSGSSIMQEVVGKGPGWSAMMRLKWRSASISPPGNLLKQGTETAKGQGVNWHFIKMIKLITRRQSIMWLFNNLFYLSFHSQMSRSWKSRFFYTESLNGKYHAAKGNHWWWRKGGGRK